MDWQYTNDRKVQLQRCTPHSSRWCCLHESWRCCPRVSWQCNSVVCQVLANAVHIHVDLVPICSKICEVLAVQPARAPAVPPARATLSMQLWQCFPHVPRRCHLHASQRCLAGKRFSPISGTASCRCSDGVSHTRRDVASPASVTVPLDCIDRGTKPWWWAHSGTAAYAQSSRFHVSIAILTSDGGLKLLLELLHSASLVLPSLLAVLSVMTASHAHVAAVLPANISDLSR